MKSYPPFPSHAPKRRLFGTFEDAGSAGWGAPFRPRGYKKKQQPTNRILSSTLYTRTLCRLVHGIHIVTRVLCVC